MSTSTPTAASMHCYSLTIQDPSAITQAVLGQFAGTKEQLLVTGNGALLKLHKPDPTQGKITEILSHNVFGIIRSLGVFRQSGSVKDYLIIGSDSGRITILEYNQPKNRWNRIHLETFGKSGIRRVVPGQYLALDPKGRACLIASVEKNKLVYVINRNAQAQLTISSPLEAHKSSTLLFSLVALDVGYDNPIFAALEVDYGDSDQDPTGEAYEAIEKMLVYYELDLGLNHVVRKWSEPVDRSASLLFQVPGGNDGPSGVLICSRDSISYRHSNQDPYRVPIPRRRGATEDPQRKRQIICGVMHKMKGAFFFLLQTEDGDLFKVTCVTSEDEGNPAAVVEGLKIKYFDTVPQAINLCILKSGFLFVACETGNHHFYQFEKLGDDDEETEFNSADYSADPADELVPVYFHPRPAENISLVESVPSLNPTIASQVADLLNDGTPQIYSACGTGARSTFRTLKHGLAVTEIVESELPNRPSAVWTTKLTSVDQHDAYIILSFADATLVLSIGETVEEAVDTGLLTSAPTLTIQQMGDEAIVQVHSKGIRHIGANKAINEWPVPQHRSIVAAAANARQVAVALSSGDVIYFELDDEGQLAEYEEPAEMSGTVTALALGPVPEGRVRSSFLAVGCDNATVRILSLEPDSTLESKSIQALTSAPNSLVIMPMEDSSQSTAGVETLYLHIGLVSGVYIRTVLDDVTGELSDTRTRFLGPKPTKLFQVDIRGKTAVLALSTKPWLGFSDPQTRAFVLSPLDYVALEWGWSFSSEQYSEGMVGIQGATLRIFTVESLTSSPLLQTSLPLSHTPKRLTRHPTHPLFYIISSDPHTLSAATSSALYADPSVTNGDATPLDPQTFGHPRGRNHWASAIEVIDPVAQSVVSTLRLEGNESAVSVAVVSFASQEGSPPFLVVGTAKNLVFDPKRAVECGYIHVYRLTNEGRSLELVHKTKTDEPPMALLPFQGRLLAGTGAELRIYDLGIRQLLRKAQASLSGLGVRNIVALATQGSRIIAADVSQSVTYLVYKFAENKILPFADDTVCRWTTAMSMLDYETVVGGDKFGGLWVVRCPEGVSKEADEEGSAGLLMGEKGYLGGSRGRVELMAHAFCGGGDIPMSVSKARLVSGGRDVIIWTGLMGTIGIWVPFVSKEDVSLFKELEVLMRAEEGGQGAGLAGRDHLAYRSAFVPVKAVVDGDLCERFMRLDMASKSKIAGELDRQVREVERKVQDMRSRVAF